MKRLLYLNNASSTFFSHRIGWARAARQAGWSVTVAGPFSGEEARRLREEGWAVEPFALTRGVGRPTDELRTFARLRAPDTRTRAWARSKEGMRRAEPANQPAKLRGS